MAMMPCALPLTAVHVCGMPSARRKSLSAMTKVWVELYALLRVALVPLQVLV